MNEVCRLASMILRDIFPRRHLDHSELGQLLHRLCPDDTMLHAIEKAVVRNILDGPTEFLCLDERQEWVPVLPFPELTVLVAVVEAQVIRQCQGVVAEILDRATPPHWKEKHPRFEGDKLFVGNRVVGRWREQEIGNRPQIDLLQAFQTKGWADKIPIPFDSCRHPIEDVCKNLNRKLKNWLHFRSSLGEVYWSWS